MVLLKNFQGKMNKMTKKGVLEKCHTQNFDGKLIRKE